MWPIQQVKVKIASQTSHKLFETKNRDGSLLAKNSGISSGASPSPKQGALSDEQTKSHSQRARAVWLCRRLSMGLGLSSFICSKGFKIFHLDHSAMKGYTRLQFLVLLNPTSLYSIIFLQLHSKGKWRAHC